MKSVDEVRQFCQEQADFHEKQAARSNVKPERQARHVRLADKFKDAVAVLGNSQQYDQTLSQGDLFRIDPYDVSDLPEELVNELTIPKSDNDEVRMVHLLRLAGRPLSINEIMVGLFRKFGDVSKRTTVNSRLYRMANKGDLVSMEKGVYALADHLNGGKPEHGGEGAS